MTTEHTNAVHAGPGLEFCPMMSNYGAPSLTLVEGKGTEVWDNEGVRYLDFLGGLAVTSLGHCHPTVSDAIAEQAHTLIHVSNLYNTIPGPEVAITLDRLLQTFPGAGAPSRQLGQILFQNSGAEANEAAIKLARKYNGRGRHVVLSAMRSFHGRTLATLHATGQPEKHETFHPLPEGFRHAAYDDVDAMEAALDPTVGAILVEPIQGEGGVNTPDPQYLRDLRALCDDRSLLLILDEIQTGIARTGAWFGFQHAGIMPDIVTMAKGLGNGMPIGAVWAKREVAEVLKPGDHGSTFAGQPLAAAAARAVLAVMEQMDAPRIASERGAELTAALLALDGVESVRGAGLLLAAELNEDGLRGRTAGDISAACAANGVLVNGVTKTALRFAPPITVSSGEIEEAIRKIDTAIKVGA
ncbi:MAG: acetylornithine/succinylornithine family transaminase [Acidimicrobiia bacterium]|nr:acetylornithine/succinylornithine family transaminase [Acidimicrobiia bacterium]